MSLSQTIAELRTANDLSQQELADRLFVSRDLVSKWERGERTPGFRTVEKIAETFGVPVDRLCDRRALLVRELEDCLPEERAFEDGELTALLDRFLRGVSPRTADVFLNRYYLLKTTSEIAEKYKIRENHVRSILSKTRKRLKKALQEGKA